jgi:hypothetical protein
MVITSACTPATNTPLTPTPTLTLITPTLLPTDTPLPTKTSVPTKTPIPPTATIQANDSEELHILFIYRQGSISSADVKHIAEAANLTIKTKSSPPRLMPGASNMRSLEQITLAEFGAMLSGKGESETGPKNEKKDVTPSGAKLTKADAARMAKSPTLGELFREHGPVLFFNAKQKSEGGPGPCPRPISPSCVEIVSPPLVPFCMCLLDFDIVRFGLNKRMSSPDTSQRLIVITFNQTPETIGEFKRLFCTLYHGDCGGPIGKPTPLTELVTVRTYAPLKWNGPIEDEKALRQALDNRALDTPIKFGDQPAQTITCMRRDAKGNCNWWRICGSLGPNGAYRCYDIIDFGPGIGWQVAW